MEEKLKYLANNEDADFPAGPLIIEVSDEKPFNKCLTCQFLSNGCSGPNLTAMTVTRVCEFLQLRRLMLGYTYQKTADLAKLSLVTVKRYLTNKVKDPSFLIIQALASVLVCDPNGKYPCPIHLFPDEAEKAIADCRAAQEALAQREHDFELDITSEHTKTEFLKEQLLFLEEQLKEKDKTIADWRHSIQIKDRYICVLAVAVGIALAIIFGALIIDKLNPHLGFIWRAAL